MAEFENILYSYIFNSLSIFDNILSQINKSLAKAIQQMLKKKKNIVRPLILLES